VQERADHLADRLSKSGHRRPSPGSRAGWADLYDWRAVERSGTAPSVVHQAYMQVRSAVLSGGLRPGTKLPSSRDLAGRLGIARASVIGAYEQLLAEGYLAARTGSGTYVSSDLPEPVEDTTPVPDTARGLPQARSGHARPEPSPGHADAGASPAHTDERPFNTGRTLVDARTAKVWRRLTHRAARRLGPADLGYTDPRGSPELRRAVCDYLLAARAVRCDPEQVLVTSGSQHAIDLVARVLLRPGDEAWVEDPGYPLTRHALAAAGMVIRPIPVDTQGLDVAAGTGTAPRARVAIVTPSHQYPTGVVLSMARRLELLAWARAHGSWIVEDDYSSEFRYSGRPLASLQGLDGDDRVIYVGTLNKALFPGLRLGYAVVPTPMAKAFARARDLMDRQPPSLYQAVAAEFMLHGHLTAHIRRMRLQYRAQRDALAGELERLAGDQLTVAVPDQGMHLIAYLRDGTLSDTAVARAAREAGVIVRAMSPLYVTAPSRPGLMLGFSGYPCEVIVPAATRLAKVMEEQDNRRQTRREVSPPRSRPSSGPRPA